jgi:dual oxidase
MRSKFEIFWYFHKVFFIIFIVTFLHGLGKLFAEPNYWKFIILPGVIFCLELTIDIYRFFNYKAKIVSVKTVETDVIELIVNKPKLFQNRPGQYSRINIPEISFLQYHPITIASGSHHPNLVFYISTVGNWTKSLLKIAKQFKENPEIKVKSLDNEIDFNVLKNKTHYLFYQQKPIENVMLRPYCRLDGPLGAPCENFEKYKKLIFIAGGIGITPFTSILYSMINDLKFNRELNFESIHLIWVVRQFSSAKWIIHLIKRIFNEDIKNIFKINLYITNTDQKSDLRSFFLWHGIELLKTQNKGKISGYCDNINWGRPNWQDVFKSKRYFFEINKSDNSKENIGVFVCANYLICKDVLINSRQFSGEGIEFEFYKEHF